MRLEWQQIETAPRDGTRIILGSAGNEPVMGSWREYADGGGWSHGDEESDVPYGPMDDPRWTPTHWMPLPEPPQ